MTRHPTDPVLPPGRRAGVGLHITSLPGPFGIGDVGRGARQFVDMLREMRLGVWQFLPTGPTAYGDSPYQPLSTFAGNEMLIDVADLIENQLLSTAETAELTGLDRGFVDYGRLIPAKTRLLRLAASRFGAQASSEQQQARDEWVEKQDKDWLHDYALYRILKSQHDERPWPEWQPPFVHREHKALRAIEQRERAGIDAIKTLQFLFHRQWRQLREYAAANGVRLFGDLPIYIALDSADAWVNRDILLIDRDGRPDFVAGVPPDYFSADGQRWGNPLYAWPQHAANDFRWWIARLRAKTELADIVRIDHFRGFESYWAVPATSATAREGSWEPGPGDALFDALHKAMGKLPIVAEDLGVITPAVRALRERHAIPGMVVLQFDVVNTGFSLASVAANSVCYTGTHDNDTTIGWFRGSPGDMRSATEIEDTQRAALRLTGGTAGTIHTDLVRAAFSTAAALAIAPLQDYLGLGSEARLNTPGKPSNNWRWRVREEQLSADLCRHVAGLVQDSGRANQGFP